jgi:RNA polymerase sigma-70 factor (ECF subfamily)
MTKETGIPGGSDEELLERAVSDFGGTSGRLAASELLRRHQRRVYLWCYRYFRDHERAVDAAQDVLLSAYRALSTFERRSRFSSWLFAITRNRCLKALAAPRWLRDEDAGLDHVPDPAPGPEEAYLERQNEDRLREIIARHLDPEESEALWLRCFEKMPVDEIGRVLRLDNATGARALLQRARRRLRAALERDHTESER